MNNKGFGVWVIFGFIIIICFALISMYSFVRTTLYDVLFPKENIPNYKNEYVIYMKDHNIKYEK